MELVSYLVHYSRSHLSPLTPGHENEEKITSGLESSSSESMGHPVWSLQSKQDHTDASNAPEFTKIGSSLTETTLTSNLLNLLNVRVSVGHERGVQVISEPKPSQSAG